MTTEQIKFLKKTDLSGSIGKEYGDLAFAGHIVETYPADLFSLEEGTV